MAWTDRAEGRRDFLSFVYSNPAETVHKRAKEFSEQVRSRRIGGDTEVADYMAGWLDAYKDWSGNAKDQ